MAPSVAETSCLRRVLGTLKGQTPTHFECQVICAVNVTGLHAGWAERGGPLLHEGLLQGPTPGEAMGPMMIVVEVGTVLDQNSMCGTADRCHSQVHTIAAVAVHEGIGLCSRFSLSTAKLDDMDE